MLSCTSQRGGFILEAMLSKAASRVFFAGCINSCHTSRTLLAHRHHSMQLTTVTITAVPTCQRFVVGHSSCVQLQQNLVGKIRGDGRENCGQERPRPPSHYPPSCRTAAGFPLRERPKLKRAEFGMSRFQFCGKNIVPERAHCKTACNKTPPLATH